MNTFKITGDLGITDESGRMIATCDSEESAKLILKALQAMKPRKRETKNKARFPAPIYVASYADGSSVRMSFYSLAAKPIDVAAARAQAACHRPVKTRPDSEYPFGKPTGRYIEMTTFHVEYQGEELSGSAWRLIQAKAA